MKEIHDLLWVVEKACGEIHEVQKGRTWDIEKLLNRHPDIPAQSELEHFEEKKMSQVGMVSFVYARDSILDTHKQAPHLRHRWNEGI